MGANAVRITDADFERTTGQKGLVLVDFYADWCGPCRIVSPILEQIAGELQGKLLVAKVNVDTDGRNAQKFGVMSIPTLVLFKDGKAVDMVVGAAPKAELQRWIQQYLQGNGGPGGAEGYR